MQKYGIHVAFLCILALICKTGPVFGQNTPFILNYPAFCIDSSMVKDNPLSYYENLYCDQKSIRLGEKQFHLLNSFYLLDAGNQNTSIQEIQSPDYQKKFKLLKYYDKLNKNQIYWGKIIIHNKIKDTVQWAFYPGWTQYVDVFYKSEKKNTFHHLKTGYYRPQNKNDELYTLSNIVPLSIHPGKDSSYAETVIYVKYACTDNYTLRIQPILYQIDKLKTKYAKYIQHRNLIQGFYQGILWLIIAYSIFTFLFTKERLHLLYAFYCVLFSLLSLFLAEFMINKIISNREIHRFIPNAIGPLFGIAYVLFIRKFLMIKVRYPKFNIFLLIAIGFFIVSCITSTCIVYFTNNYGVQIYVSHGINLMSAFILLVVIIKLLHKLNKLSLFIAFGSFAFLAGYFIYAFYLLYYKVLMLHFFQVGQVIELLVFSLGLGYRFRLLEKEKQESMSLLVEQLKENQKLQNRVNRELELKVKERTKEISRKNQELQIQNTEIKHQRDQIQKQKEIVSVQKKELLDSITYAQRIQNAVLPPQNDIDNIVPEHFIFYRPRDIVSGDFYWIKRIDELIIISAADCTGHGVPGALLSMLGISLLNEIVQHNNFTVPNMILNELRDNLMYSLRQSRITCNAKDGMDLALCAINKKTNELQYAGAYNPLYILRDSEIIEIKPDKMPVGAFLQQQTSFTNHQFTYEKNDKIYLFTDGYIDQFGGEHNKKFLSKNFKKLLISIGDKPMAEQNKILSQTFIEWKGKNDQIDDILIIGIKL